MNTTIETFMQYDYAETRDLLKAFITLISATLVFSLAFVDKIVGIAAAQPFVRHLVFGAWTSFFLALALAGAGIVMIAAAAGCILYGGLPVLPCGFGTFALLSWAAGVSAGALYLLGLLLLTLAARQSLLRREAGGMLLENSEPPQDGPAEGSQ